MQSVAELQARFARAVTGDDSAAVAGALVGGSNPRGRLAIHQNHYAASLTAALRQKFPASAWLVGEHFMTAAARAYVRARPPLKPCIAEYGGGFPEFLAAWNCAPALPYLQSFAELEWAVGQVAIAVDTTAVTWSEIAAVGTEALLDCRLTLQPGTRYLRSSWRVDRLMTMYLGDAQTETFVLPEEETCIEVRGARGALSIERIDPGTFAFRTSLAERRSIGEAASAALERDAVFDAGDALRRLVESGLVTEVIVGTSGDAT
jgi:hypothetical protein